MTYDRFPECLRVCFLGRSGGSCPRNALDLPIYSACASWPTRRTRPMTKCVFDFKWSLFALHWEMTESQHTQMRTDPLTHTHNTGGRTLLRWWFLVIERLRETLMERRIKGRWDKSGFTKNLERERCLQGQRLLKRLWSRFRSLWPVPLKDIQCVSH